MMHVDRNNSHQFPAYRNWGNSPEVLECETKEMFITDNKDQLPEHVPVPRKIWS